MRIATWNVNNVRKRLPQLLEWLARSRPDVVALQELKTETAAFPKAEIEAAGYGSLVAGQRTWNGVALLSRGFEPIEIRRSLPGDAADKQARFIEAAIDGVAVACLYLPNGNPQPGPKFVYKLAWFERLVDHAAALMASGNPVVLAGDFNVVPTDALDIYSPASWKGNALLRPEARAAWERLLAQGWTDAIRARFPADKVYTFWDYMRNRWPRDAGLRIDHLLLSKALTLVDAGIDKEMRGNADPSDHAPAWVEVEIAARPARKRARKPAAANAPDVPLATYNARRDFSVTAEPEGVPAKRPARARKAHPAEALSFVIQKHWASRLHYDFRLELDGVMLSWAVPKGPSFDPAMKSMAIHVEDHPIGYSAFEGTIPAKQYGAGTVIKWDEGTWEPEGDPREGLAKGKILFRLHGQKLAGLWELVRISKPGAEKQDQWMLFKKRGDAWARPLAEYDVITALPDSVVAHPLGPVEEREPERVAVARPSPASLDAEASGLATAPDSPLPAKLAPQLATLASAAAPGVQWVVENKFDGYRLLARVDGRKVQLFTRNGHDWTAKLRDVAAAVAALGLESGWLDGEIVVMNASGVPDFNALQNAIDNARTAGIVYFVFDLPFHAGKDLRQVPLLARRARLQALVAGGEGDALRFSQSFDVAPAQMMAAACQLGMEGIIAKRADAPYVSSRTDTWLKLKCGRRQEFVVVGYTDRAGAHGEVGGLLLGYHGDDGELRSGGSVGSGWDSRTAQDLHERLSRLRVDAPAVDPATLVPGRWSKRSKGSEHWVEPTLVVEVAFGEWTPDGHVRHAVFKGVRTDKPAGAITMERAVGPAPPAGPPRTSVKVTNPDRVIDPATGLKKVDLVRYYESIADRMLPHLQGRPASLVRAPDGVSGKQFFQKHDEAKLPGLTQLDAALWPGHDALLAVDTAQALVSAAQMNVIEFHTWNSMARNIDKPDRVIFDLDPGEGVTWANLQEAATLMRTLLTELGLQAWLKTSGGKGLHVVVPLAPRLDYETVKNFSQAAVRHMAKVIPSRFVAVAGGGNRVGRIFIDYLRNGHAQTTAAAFSARARPGLGVSMPVSWEQLPALKSGAQWTIATAREYVSFQQDDPWAGYWKTKQSLAAAMKALGVAPRAATPKPRSRAA